ncbi:hypothetical protein WJX77_010346 [Trebouxia sp. C0004]
MAARHAGSIVVAQSVLTERPMPFSRALSNLSGHAGLSSRPERAAEDELMVVADEKDKLAPQLEEARWRNRQLEKDVQQLQDTSNATEQDLDRKESAAEKQRESIMVGFNKTKSELGTLQDALAKTQIDLEKTNFELHAKKKNELTHTNTALTQTSELNRELQVSQVKAEADKQVAQLTSSLKQAQSQAAVVSRERERLAAQVQQQAATPQAVPEVFKDRLAAMTADRDQLGRQLA